MNVGCVKKILKQQSPAGKVRKLGSTLNLQRKKIEDRRHLTGNFKGLARKNCTSNTRKACTNFVHFCPQPFRIRVPPIY